MRFSRFSRRFSAWILVISLLFVCPRAKAETVFAYVKNGGATAYSDAACKQALGELEAYIIVTVLGQLSGVIRVSVGSKEGYVKKDRLCAVSASGENAVVSRKTKVYARPDTASPSVSVSAKTEVNVLMTSGDWVMVEKNGSAGYMKAADLTKAETPQKDSVVYEDFEAQVIAPLAKVYAKPSTKSKKLGTLLKDEIVSVTAYSGEWALIERNGHTGYCRISDLTRDVNPYAYMLNSRYTNEEIVYLFLIREMHLNTAAACGVMANIKYESGYRPDAVGDKGKSVGICQWFALRNTRLQNFCKNRSYDPGTLYGQLWYLKYELENYYPKVLNVLKNVENSEQGAYDAGYSFCYDFEGPANRLKLSETRAQYARITLWNRYKNR